MDLAIRRALVVAALAATLAAPATAQSRLSLATFDADALTTVETDAATGAPTFLAGHLAAPTGVPPADAAARFLAANAAVFGLTDPVVVRGVETDPLGLTHVRVQQTVGGVPVFGGDAVVHLDRAGGIYALSGHLRPAEAAARTSAPAVSADQALASARADVQPAAERRADELAAWTPDAHLVWLPAADGALVLAYHVRLYQDQPFPANWNVFVDAATGAVIERWNAIHTVAGPASPVAAAPASAPFLTAVDAMMAPVTGSGTSHYSGTVSLPIDQVSASSFRLYDTTRGNGIRTRSSNGGTSLPGSDITSTTSSFTSTTVRSGVDAHWGAVQVYDYFQGTHGRNSYDGAGAALNSTVRYSTSYNNAFWNGTYMVYGEGDGSTFSPLVELDICAHELTHAVTERTAGLVYNREPGALNESVSDILAVMVDRDDWWVGDRSYTPGTSGDALRYMDTPTRGSQPDHYANRLYPGTCSPTQNNDYCGVHSNSGIPNHAAYLMAAGGTKSGVTVAAIGRADTERIWYRALTTYFTTSTTFAGARTGTIQAATDLFGASSAQVASVTNAWSAVGVGGGTPPPPANDTYEPNNTTAQAYAVASGTTYNSFIASSTDQDYYKVTATAAGTIAVTLGGAAGDYDLYLLNSAGTQVAASESGTSTESISYSASAAGTFYVRVVGYNGVFSTTDDYQVRATFPTGTTPTGQWYTEARTYESAHNYTNNLNTSVTYSKPGATQVMVYFDRFELETNYDYVYLRDAGGTARATYTGTRAAFWSSAVTGSSVTINFRTDGSVVRWGWRVTQVAYFANGQLLGIEAPTGEPLAEMPTPTPSDPLVTAAAKLFETALAGARPNPSTGAATVAFSLAEAAPVRVSVVDVLGREVAVLADGPAEPGAHEATVRGLAPGTYIVRMDAAGERFTRALTVVR